ncbi:MAG: hypothetical protein GC192_10340 [Bacteroidetes bacterium]|nr:hypothetical protein [Bacteroidota bacterium]
MKISFFIRIADEKYLRQTQKEGILYMNPINHHKAIETNVERRDDFEGIERIEQMDWFTVKLEEREINFTKLGPSPNLTTAHMRIDNAGLTGNIFSLIAVTSELVSEFEKLDEKLMEFGNAFLIINNPSEFLNRVKNALNELNIQPTMGLVEYYDENAHTGDLNVFYKPKRFKHQSEYRVFVDRGENSPFVLKIGSIEDISFFYPIEKLKNLRMKIGDAPMLGIAE